MPPGLHGIKSGCPSRRTQGKMSVKPAVLPEGFLLVGFRSLCNMGHGNSKIIRAGRVNGASTCTIVCVKNVFEIA